MVHNAYNRASLIMQKAKGPKWKRELVSDHKFDFIDIEEFREHTCLLTIRYFVLLCAVLVSAAVYCSDVASALILLIYDHWSLSTQPKIPFNISKWIFVGCIAISFMLLAWEIRKARTVMDTRDISLAVTNTLAYSTYSVKSYSHFCLLQKIKNSTKWSDVIIFYVFYTLKSWKRVIIAQGPRQIIAGITVYALLKSAWTDPKTGYFKFSADWNTYGEDWPQRVALLLMSFTCLLWIFATLQIVLAVLLYFPILCHIQGNLKEYCCHKIDKRIDELLEKQRKKRLREREKYAQSLSSKKSKKSTKTSGNKNVEEVEPTPALPTLPVIANVDLYAGEKKNSPWLYQQPQSQHSFNNYYDSQPMTPLESTSSLQRNPTKYSPYNETPYIKHPTITQPANAHSQHGNMDNYYYPPVSKTNTSYNDSNNKPHAYDDPPVINNGSRSNNLNTYDNSSYNNLNTYNKTSNTSSTNYSQQLSTVTASQTQAYYSNNGNIRKDTSTGYNNSESTYSSPTITNTTTPTTIKNATVNMTSTQDFDKSNYGHLQYGNENLYQNTNAGANNYFQPHDYQHYHDDDMYGTQHSPSLANSKVNVTSKQNTYKNYI